MVIESMSKLIGVADDDLGLLLVDLGRLAFGASRPRPRQRSHQGGPRRRGPRHGRVSHWSCPGLFERMVGMTALRDGPCRRERAPDDDSVDRMAAWPGRFRPIGARSIATRNRFIVREQARPPAAKVSPTVFATRASGTGFRHIFRYPGTDARASAVGLSRSANSRTGKRVSQSHEQPPVIGRSVAAGTGPRGTAAR